MAAGCSGESDPSAPPRLVGSAQRRLNRFDVRCWLRHRPGLELAGAAEARLYRRSWSIRLEDIGVPVDLWHGELDENVPISVGRYLADALPACRTRFLEDEGHLTLPRKRMAEVLDDLLSGSQLP